MFENNFKPERKFNIIQPQQNNLFDLSSPPMEIMDTIKKEIPAPENLGSTMPPKKINQELKQIVCLYGEKKKENINYENNNNKVNSLDNKEKSSYLNTLHQNSKINVERNSSIPFGEKNGLNHNFASNNKKSNNDDSEYNERYNLATPVMKERKKSEGEKLNLNAMKDLNLDGFLESWQAPPVPSQGPLENNSSMLYYQPRTKLDKYYLKILNHQELLFFESIINFSLKKTET